MTVTTGKPLPRLIDLALTNITRARFKRRLLKELRRRIEKHGPPTIGG